MVILRSDIDYMLLLSAIAKLRLCVDDSVS